MTKECTECKEIKDISRFRSGKRPCRECLNKKRAYAFAVAFKNDPDYRKRHILKASKWNRENREKRIVIERKSVSKRKQSSPEKFKARSEVGMAVKAKRIPRASDCNCSFCESKAVHYHHHQGYSKENWLNVIPVCIPCHIAHEVA